VEVDVVVCVDVVQREAGLLERLELGTYLRLQLSADTGPEEEVEACGDEIPGEFALLVHQIRDQVRRQDGSRFDEGHVKADPEGSQSASPFHGIGRRGSADHETCRGENPAGMGLLNRLVHRHREAEIIGSNDKSEH
jgi:hypothetical protein